MRNRQAVFVVVMVLAMALPEGLDSCAIGAPEPVFEAHQRPASLKRAYVEGKLGILRPSNQTKHLIAAYRIMHGARLSASEIDAIFHAPERGPAPFTSSAAYDQWQKERGATVSQPPAPFVVLYKQIHKDSFYSSYLNCNDDSFITAALTLRQRSTTWGAQSQNVRDWLAGQDQVFSNCGGKDPVIPNALPAGADPLLAADRQYQIAAATFYTGDFSKARLQFQAIAENTVSPWRSTARYLVARCYLRQGTVNGDRGSLLQAQAALQSILKDPSANALHKSATGLLDFVEIRLDPAGKLSQLEARILKPQAGDFMASVWADYDFLYHAARSRQKRDPAELGKAGDMTDWLLSIEQPRSDQHVLDRWRETGRPEWLLAVLMGQQPSIDDAVKAARSYPGSDPAYEAITYHGLRRETDPARVRTWADQALANDLSVSTRNALRSERMHFALDWKEFLIFAPRLPEPNFEEFDGSEAETNGGFSAATPLFDIDAASAFNSNLPLSRWLDAALNPLVPAGLQMEISQAAWMRAVLLDRPTLARQARQRIAQSDSAALPYLSDQTDADAKFDAIFLLLRQRDLAPFVAIQSSGGKKLDQFSDLGAGQWQFVQDCGIGYPRGLTQTRPPDQFPPQDWKDQAHAECEELKNKAPVGANWLALQTMEWAKSRPGDPRVPQALHLAVQATRRGITDAKTGAYSKEAFNLLHRKYPRSEWAAKTKYWFKGIGS